MHTINNKKENNHIKTKPKKPINLTGWESGDRRKEGRNGSEGSWIGNEEDVFKIDPLRLHLLEAAAKWRGRW